MVVINGIDYSNPSSFINTGTVSAPKGSVIVPSGGTASEAASVASKTTSGGSRISFSGSGGSSKKSSSSKFVAIQGSSTGPISTGGVPILGFSSRETGSPGSIEYPQLSVVDRMADPNLVGWIQSVTDKTQQAGFNVTGMNFGVTPEGHVYIKDIDVEAMADPAAQVEADALYYAKATGNWPVEGRLATIWDYMLGREIQRLGPSYGGYYPGDPWSYTADLIYADSFQYTQGGEYYGNNHEDSYSGQRYPRRRSYGW